MYTNKRLPERELLVLVVERRSSPEGRVKR